MDGATGARVVVKNRRNQFPVPQRERSLMSESDTYKIVEIAGTSPDGVTEAMRSGVARAAATLRDVDWIEVRSIRGHVENGEIAHFQVEMRVGFKLERP